ncbi:MAG: hypothetical protein CML03_00335 [Pseudooceanicola sp.]|jgi:hypothetical protein|nr:hypothetical protein [Pseudooceanicola sp.]|tara:strand:- start:5986 stop:6444 length:459 start_codon:yes stop_codon:yes gene_type:complete
MAFPTLDYNLINKSEVPSALGGEAIQLVHVAKTFVTGALAVGKVTAVLRMPANTRYVDLYADADDLDSGTPALTFDVGIAGVSDTTYDDIDCFLDGSTIGQAGTGGDQAMLQAGAGLLVPVEHYITITAAVAAATAVEGDVRLGIQCVLGTS